MVASSLYLPEKDEGDVPGRPLGKLAGFLGKAGPEETVLLAQSLGADAIEALRTNFVGELESYTNDQIKEALRVRTQGENDPREDWLSSPRGEEYVRLANESPVDTPFLKVIPQGGNNFGAELGLRFHRINLVPRLRETRAMYGFDRVRTQDGVSKIDRKRMLWIGDPDEWLPGYVVIGEGIFFEFNPEEVHAWREVNHGDLTRRLSIVSNNQQRASSSGRKKPVTVTAELLLVHTFAHLLINRLVYDCGYQAASLRERIYCSPDGAHLGVLIYTAAGDSDGTMGGLVRMGRPDRLVPAIRRALEEARWCSSDPVCSDIGGTAGQGPDSVNLAACHSCALVPETSCETGNRYLDRAVLVGTLSEPNLGFFPKNI